MGIHVDSPLQRQWTILDLSGSILRISATVLGAARSSRRAQNRRRDSQNAAAQVQDSPLPLERRVNLDSDGRAKARTRVRESHQPSRARDAAALPWWHQ